VLFNPALTDLTSLEAEFLSSRPSLIGFLDRLREKRVMPEPRDYRSWRASIAEIEAASRDGTYSETWSLPDGQTYRVSGRPHPDGAVALLFEDISAEMSLTRKFRSQLEQSQEVIDALDDAVVIFSASGELIRVNAAYKELWGSAPDACLAGTSATEATRVWHEMTAPTPIWGDFRDFTLQSRDRTEWSAQATLRDGRSIDCRFVPQRGCATLAIFRVRIGLELMANKLKHAV
jgi:PAS domain-containing protein